MLKYWAPEHGETTWAMRARAQRKNHSTMDAERDLVDDVQRRADAEDLRRQGWTDLVHDFVVEADVRKLPARGHGTNQ